METKATMSELRVLRSRVPDAVVHGAACFAGVAAGAWATVEEAPASPLDEVPVEEKS